MKGKTSEIGRIIMKEITIEVIEKLLDEDVDTKRH